MELASEAATMLLLHNVEAFIFRYASIYLRRFMYGLKPLDHTNTRPLRVLHKSEHFLAVNKHEDLLYNSDEQSNFRYSLFDQIKSSFPSLHNPKLGHGFYVLHRLDFSTSGVVVIPLHKKACGEASKEFQERRTRKFYLAVVRGHVAEDRMEINLEIGEDGREEWDRVKMCTPRQEWCLKPRPSRTRLVVLERGLYNKYPATKVLLAPISGRRHQLRVHCHEIGHTIVGDFTYSNRRDILPHRMFLHAHRLLLSTKFEKLDINAGDPFTEKDPINKWTVVESVLSLQDGYSCIHQSDGFIHVE